MAARQLFRLARRLLRPAIDGDTPRPRSGAPAVSDRLSIAGLLVLLLCLTPLLEGAGELFITAALAQGTCGTETDTGGQSTRVCFIADHTLQLRANLGVLPVRQDDRRGR